MTHPLEKHSLGQAEPLGCPVSPPPISCCHQSHPSCESTLIFHTQEPQGVPNQAPRVAFTGRPGDPSQLPGRCVYLWGEALSSLPGMGTLLSTGFSQAFTCDPAAGLWTAGGAGSLSGGLASGRTAAPNWAEKIPRERRTPGEALLRGLQGGGRVGGGRSQGRGGGWGQVVPHRSCPRPKHSLPAH